VVSGMQAYFGSEVCVSVKGKSVFPDLLAFETKVGWPAHGQTRTVFRRIGLSCRELSASLPQADLFFLVAMLMLAVA